MKALHIGIQKKVYNPIKTILISCLYILTIVTIVFQNPMETLPSLQ